MEENNIIIGIDLGTTNSVVAVVEDGKPRVIRNAEGQPKTPSVVCVEDDGTYVVGELARRQAATRAGRTVSSVKRLIGRFYEEIDNSDEQYPFDLDEAEDGRVRIQVGELKLLPEELSAQILEKLRDAAEDDLGEKVDKAVITVPAYFDDMQRQATLEAAQLAGLKVMRLLNEPTAAAMAYGLGREGHDVVAIFDFGGGTFDFSVLDIEDNTFEVLCTTGDSRLGGDDLDNALVDHIADAFQAEHGFDLRDDAMALRRLFESAEKAKCDLSMATETLLSLPFVAQDSETPLHIERKIDRDTLEELIEPLIRHSINCCLRGLREAKIKKNDITRVILVGGSTRIPLVQDMVEDFFDIEPFKGVNPDEVVAIGASTQGAVMSGELDEVVLLDVTPHSLGIELKGNRKSTIIEKNSTIPIKAFKTFTTTENDQGFVNIHVLQGEDEKAGECRSLGKFVLSGIQEASAGVPRIRVTFFINADGIVEITAGDLSSGAERSLTINHAYLTADERKDQHKARSSQRKRRRRRKGARLDATDPAATTGGRSKGGAVATPTPRAEAELSETGDIIRVSPGSGKTLEPESEDQGVAEVIAPNEQQPMDPASTPEPVADPAPAAEAAPATEPPVESVAELSIPVAEPAPDPSATQKVAPPEIIGDGLDELDLAPTAHEQTRGATGPISPVITPSTPPPDQLIEMIESLGLGRSNDGACAMYRDQRNAFFEFCDVNPGDGVLQLLRARLHVYLKQPEEARIVLAPLGLLHPELVNELLDTYNRLCNDFANFIGVRFDRAALAASAGDYAMAITDLEMVCEREPENEKAFEELARVYQSSLSREADSTLQFKLVKVYLRQRDLDGAIAQLQQLVLEPAFRDRANKIMGLCFWQKNMRYLAWQKLRNLSLDDELKDVLYRLADDMERNDELSHAKAVYERIVEVDIGYLQVQERLRKLNYRLELEQQDNRYGGLGASTAAGSVIGGRFELIGEVNRGSMGIVYRARDKILDEVVAIKVLNDYLCADPKAVERFKHEARSARKLTHQHIVRIHDMFELDNKKIISMEFIEGEDLKTMLARQTAFMEDQIMAYLRQICLGLSYAHKLNVVHRDIKPANIIIDEHDQVKIADFGIAKLLTNESTKAGTVIMGTPLYMSPEQIEGKHIDHRADVYSLGVMLYELLTGRPPFHEGNVEYQHLHNEPPPIESACTDALNRLIMKCIRKKRDERYQTIDGILGELDVMIG